MTGKAVNDLGLSENDRFEIGGESVFVSRAPVSGDDTLNGEAIENLRIRTGTLLKTETVSFLLGAGASVDCGGPLIGKVPLDLEQDLHCQRTSNSDDCSVQPWLRQFYLAAHCLAGSTAIPSDDAAILSRRTGFGNHSVDPLTVNLEQLVALLYRWRMALPQGRTRLQIDGLPPVNATAHDLELCLSHAKRALARLCDLPTNAKKEGLKSFQVLLRKVLTRPLNLRRVNLFTLNYDTLVEQAADAEGVVLLDGFVGTHRRIFRPESYEQDLYFPAETTEGRVHRFDRVIHLYKLHGSVTWIASEPAIDNPYGVSCQVFRPELAKQMLVYPAPTKISDTLGMPYAELFRRFAKIVVRPQSVLFVVGYGFGDDHVNAIIRQALAVPSFTLVIADPNPRSDFVTALRNQNDRRVWICTGQTIGSFEGFVSLVLPDLRNEDILKKVMATRRALAEQKPFTDQSTSDGN